MMNTNVDALKNLYEQLGGDPADVANCSTSVEVLNAIAAKYGGAADAIINPDAINNIAAVASSIGGGSADLAALIDRSITSIVIPDGVRSIGNNTFTYCTSLQSVVIPNSTIVIHGAAFSDCTSLRSVVIPDGLKVIDGNAFRGCSSLESLVLPASITFIGSGAFSLVRNTIYCKFSEGAVSGAPWGATGTIVYDYND